MRNEKETTVVQKEEQVETLSAQIREEMAQANVPQVLPHLTRTTLCQYYTSLIYRKAYKRPRNSDMTRTC